MTPSNARKSSAVIAGALFLCLTSLLQLDTGGPVPITLQNAAAAMLGILLGPSGGAGAVGLFLLAGAAGLPVFPGWVSGLSVFGSVEGGYLAGYFTAAIVAGLCTLKLTESDGAMKAFPAILHGSLAGILCSYITAVSAYKNIAGVPLGHALSRAFVPYLAADAVKLAVIVAAAGALRKKVSSYVTGGTPSAEKED